MTAKEMFEELGYEYIKHKSHIGISKGDVNIMFWYKGHNIDMYGINYISDKLQMAINSQIIDLGWNKMKPIKEYQEAVNYLKGYYDYEIDKEYAKKINTIQEIIDNYSKLEEALKNCKKCQGCMGMKEVFKNEQ